MSLNTTRVFLKFSAQSCPTLCDSMDCSTLSFPLPNSQSLLKILVFFIFLKFTFVYSFGDAVLYVGS